MKYWPLLALAMLASCQYTPDFRGREQPATFYQEPQEVDEVVGEVQPQSDTPIEEDLD